MVMVYFISGYCNSGRGDCSIWLSEDVGTWEISILKARTQSMYWNVLYNQQKWEETNNNFGIQLTFRPFGSENMPMRYIVYRAVLSGNLKYAYKYYGQQQQKTANLTRANLFENFHFHAKKKNTNCIKIISIEIKSRFLQENNLQKPHSWDLHLKWLKIKNRWWIREKKKSRNNLNE